MGWRRRAELALALALSLVARGAAGQGVDPRGDWRTLATLHFRVHFRAEHEALGRRAAANAERAWAQLAAELAPPRGPVELVVADNVDFTNGYATVFPSNRIVVYAQPPVDVASLRFYDDWSQLVITHELTHVFHLDRSRGAWRLGQRVLGRNPLLFPNVYLPGWVTEGLATYYESQLTGAGRVAGTEHRLLARSTALDGRVPRLDQLSQESSVYPGGQASYAYGSLLLDYLARHAEPGGMRRFVDRTAASLNPFRLNVQTRRAFGRTVTNGWAAWRDSLAADVRGETPDTSAWRTLTREGFFVAYPRWLGRDTLIVAESDARSVPGAFAVGLDGSRTRIGRRNTLAPNVPLGAGPNAGALLYAQLEWRDPFTVRSDLWVQRRDARGPDFGAAAWGERRLTRGARLTHPDARATDGAIVAVQGVAGTTRLVRLDPTGGALAAITRASPDTQWAEPRWAPGGDRIAAVRLTRGGSSAIVVLDTAGRALQVLGAERAVVAAPSWSGDGAWLYWASDRSGVPQAYGARVADPERVWRLSDVAIGLAQPVPAPGGGLLAALLFRGDGAHLAVAADTARREAADDARWYAATSRVGAPDSASGAARPYTPWRTLLPRYWMPSVLAADGGGTLVGALTSGTDVLGRHAYDAEALVNARTGDLEASLAWRYRRLGQPTVDVSASQGWQYDSVLVRRRAGGVDTLPLDRRTRTVALGLSLLRPRYRTNASLGATLALETRAYRSTLPALVTFTDTTVGRTFPSLALGGSWLNTRRPRRSISPEDGVALSGSVQQRWQDGRLLGGTSRRAVGSLRAYKALDLPGFAHHVVALRVVGGVADARASSEFSAGGVSGTVAQLVPGLTVGDPTRTFAVRGFGAGAQRGLRAPAASLEYRAPLALPARGLSLLPVFLDRVSVSAFADAGSAWCPASIDRAVQTLCRRSLVQTPDAPRWLTSVGAELNLDAAVQYDAGLRARVGFAAPIARQGRASGPSAYVTLGTAF